MYTTKECVHFPCFAGYVQTWCARPRVQCFFSFFLKILFPTTSTLCVMTSIYAHRVCPQWDGRANVAWDNPKGLRNIARPLCTTLVDNIGSTTQMWGWGAMGNTHPKSLNIQTLSVALDITTRQVGSIAREGIIGNNCPCTDYGITRRHKPVSTSVTSKCYQGCLNPI